MTYGGETVGEDFVLNMTGLGADLQEKEEGKGREYQKIQKLIAEDGKRSFIIILKARTTTHNSKHW